MVTHTGQFTAGSAAQLEKSSGSLVLEIDGKWRLSCSRIHSAGHALDVGMLALGHTIRPTKGYHFAEGPYVEYGELVGRCCCCCCCCCFFSCRRFPPSLMVVRH